MLSYADTVAEKDFTMISAIQPDGLVETSGIAPELVTRKALMHDIPAILALINGYAARGIMLPRTEFEISETIRDFTLVLRGGELVGCGALHFYSPTVGEIRSLAVEERAKAHGVGRRLVAALIEEAQIYELGAVFAFTYVVDFFKKNGFEVVDRGVLPLKAWKDCLRCPKFHACDEIAVLRVLRLDRWKQAHAPVWAPDNDTAYIQSPVPLNATSPQSGD